MSRGALPHPMSTVMLARELHGTGMTPWLVHAELQRRGFSVTYHTVRSWVDEDYARRRNTAVARNQRRHTRTKDSRLLDKVMVELRTEGNLSYESIAYVVGRYHGVKLGEHRVRQRCHAAGVPKNPKKVALAVHLPKGRQAA